MSWNLGWIRLFTLELFALECWIFFPINLRWRKWCIHLFSVQSPSNLQVMRTGIKAWTSSNYGQIWSIIWSYVPLNGGKKMMFIFSHIFFKLEFKFQCFCYAEIGFDFSSSSSSFNSSTKGHLFSWSFELYLYLELTVPQVSDFCPLKRLVFVFVLPYWVSFFIYKTQLSSKLSVKS